MEQRDKKAASCSSSSSPSSSSSSPIKRMSSKKCESSSSARCSTTEEKYALSTIKSNNLERVFSYFDENGDGKVSAAELQRCVRTIGGELSDEDAEMAVRSSDGDGDGLLGLEDFAKLMQDGGEEERRDELRGAFEMYAVEGTRHITPKSLKRMLSRLGEKTSLENCKAMISKFDLNGDGVLSFDEFRAMMS